MADTLTNGDHSGPGMDRSGEVARDSIDHHSLDHAPRDFFTPERAEQFGKDILPMLHEMGATSDDPNEAMAQIIELDFENRRRTEPEMPTVLVHGEIEIGGQKQKYTGEFPEDPRSPSINLIFGGFGARKWSMRRLRHEQAINGQASVTVEQIRADDRSNRERIFAPHKIHVEQIDALTDAIMTNRENQKQVPSRQVYPFTQFVVEPQSMFGLPAIRFAEKHPDNVKGVIELQTVGKGSPNVLQLAKAFKSGAVGAWKKELWPFVRGKDIEHRLAKAWDELMYFGENLPRTVGEAASCISENNIERTQRVREAGIFVAYLAAQYDILVSETAHVEEHVDLYRVIPNIGHLGPQHKAAVVAGHVLDVQSKFDEAA